MTLHDLLAPWISLREQNPEQFDEISKRFNISIEKVSPDGKIEYLESFGIDTISEGTMAPIIHIVCCKPEDKDNVKDPYKIFVSNPKEA